MNTLGENLELIAEARLWIRKSSNAFDSEIVQTMDSCILDLKNAGVRKLDTDDALIRQALKLYLKAQFGYEEDSDKFAKSYEHLKSSLSLSGDYNGRDSDG